MGWGIFASKVEEKITVEEGQHFQIEVGMYDNEWRPAKMGFKPTYFEGHFEY
jgi:hypothetical protein